MNIKKSVGWMYRAPLILQTLIWIPTRIILRFFLRLEVKGLENLEGLKKPVIFAVNHSSEWDPILVPASLPFLSPLMPMFYTSREREFYEKRGVQSLFYGGFFFKIWGAYPVKVGVKNYERSLKEHIKLLEMGAGSLCIFPEGGKTPDGTTKEFKGGVSFLSKRIWVPTIPTKIDGYFRMTKKDFFMRKRKVTITFGRPLTPPSLFSEEKYITPSDHKIFAEKIRHALTRA